LTSGRTSVFNSRLDLISLPQTYTTPRQLATFHYEALAQLARAGVLPAGSVAAAVTDRPLGYRTVDIRAFEVDIVGRPVRDAAALPTAAFRLVSPDYFAVMQTPVVAGRPLSADDDDAHPRVGMVNQTMARRFWDGATPIGAQVRLGARVGQRDPLAPERGELVTIVGVVADSRQTRLIDAPVRPELFLPLAQHAPESRTMAYVVRTPADPAAAAAAIRTAMKRVDPAQPIYGVETMTNVAADAFGPKRLTTLLLGFFALVTISLSSIGLYAVVSFGVTERAQEIGVRLAVGASPGAVVRLVAAGGARMAAAGVAIGGAVAFALTQFMSSELTNVSATDRRIFAISAAMLLAVALAATLAPALRATRVDPLAVLRHE
jgi:putative ABC transport system permease protein